MGKLKYSVYVVVLLIFGCASYKTGQQMGLYDETSRAYDQAIRWGEFEEAYTYKKLSDRDKRVPDLEKYRQIRVTDYKIKKTIVDEQSFKRVLRIVDIQYYRMSNVTVKTFVDRQKWEYDEEQKRWYLLSELPAFE